MAVNPNPTPERQDGAIVVVGSSGDNLNQEAGSGKVVFRRGAAHNQADIDIGTKDNPYDLGSDGDFESGPKDAGGAEALAGVITSDSNATFTVEVDWLDDDDNVTKTHSPSALTDVSDAEFNLIMRSDKFDLRVTDTSGNATNNIHGTANAH